MSKDKFTFFADSLSITKAKDAKGNEVMRLGGIASTKDKDSDGEFLDPKGFNTSYLEKSGIVNWHHGAKTNPEAVIGEPSKVQLKPQGLYVEVDLYNDSPMARGVYKLAQVLEKNSKTRRLGFSIEGKALERDPVNEKIIKKANITGVAVTHMPKNAHTFADIIKGEVDIDDQETPEFETEEMEVLIKSLQNELLDAKVALADEIMKGGPGCYKGEDDEEEMKKGKKSKKLKKGDNDDEDDEETMDKSLNTESGAALKKEHVDQGEKDITKGEVYEQIFAHYPDIDIFKAKRVYQLINSIATMAQKNAPTNDDISKAFEMLGAESEEMTLEKAVEIGEDLLIDGTPVDDLEKELLTKGIDEDLASQAFDEITKGISDDEDDEGDDEGADDEEADDEGVEKAEDPDDALEKALEAAADGGNEAIVKAIGVLGEQNATYAKATGTILKALTEENAELKKAMEGYDERFDAIEKASLGRKSFPTARAVDRDFNNGHSDETIEKAMTDGKTVLSASSQKNDVLNALEKAAYAPMEKGAGKPDPMFEKALTIFESSGTIRKEVLNKLNIDHNVVVTQ